MPATIDIGGKTLLEWCAEMGAQKCKRLLQGPAGDVLSFSSEPGPGEVASQGQLFEKRGSRILDRGEPESVTQLSNRLDELESLSSALSVSLDALAEEVSVCNGLLLMGGGAAALASHVRSLKATKDARLEELERMQEAWENAEDELMYWAREGGPDAAAIADQVVAPPADSFRRQSSLRIASTPEEAEAQQKQLKAQVAASEQKIRKLRASIADLSEVCSRDLAEVERRGLSGGVTLVRGLRDELREIDFQLSEAKNGDATCRTKIRMIQSKIQASRKPAPADLVNGRDETITSGSGEPLRLPADPNSTIMVDTVTSPLIENDSQSGSVPTIGAAKGELTESGRILTGQSTAIAVRHGGTQGFFPLSLWQILLRIIGFGDDRPPRSTNAESQVILI
jgi:prefoldin subunit 5